MAGTVVFAITGVLAVAPKGIDIFGASVLGIITAVGGGTLRDIILGVPIFWSIDQNYIWVSFVASILAFYTTSQFSKKKVSKIILFLDSAGISLFGIASVNKVWDLGFGLPVAPVLLGILTAIGGGLIRDIIAGRQNLIMTREIYSIPVMIGCTFYVTCLYYFPEYRVFSSFVGILIIFLIRAAVIQKNLIMPSWLYTQDKNK